MPSVEIANQALTRYCGVDRITSFEEDRPEARLCKDNYGPALRALLELRPWTFARARRTLAMLTNDRPAEWAYRYSRPAEALSIAWVNNPDLARTATVSNQSPDAPREMIGNDIYSDAPDAVAEFSVEVDDYSRYSQAFRDALAANLATRIVRNITESSNRAQLAEEAAREFTDMAMVLDARNEPVRSMNQLPDFLSNRGLA